MAPKPKQPTENQQKTKIKSKNNTQDYFKIPLYRLLKKFHKDWAISTKAMVIMNDMMNDMLERIACQAGRLAARVNKKTLSDREIEAAVKLILPRELAKHAVLEANTTDY